MFLPLLLRFPMICLRILFLKACCCVFHGAAHQHSELYSGVQKASVLVCEKVGKREGGEVAVMHHSIINSRVQIKTHTLSDLMDGCMHTAGNVQKS